MGCVRRGGTMRLTLVLVGAILPNLVLKLHADLVEKLIETGRAVAGRGAGNTVPGIHGHGGRRVGAAAAAAA